MAKAALVRAQGYTRACPRLQHSRVADGAYCCVWIAQQVANLAPSAILGFLLSPSTDPPCSRVMLHQPSGGAQGQASDIAIMAKASALFEW